MHITELTGTDFKGRNMRHKLGRINVVVGRNAKGKTAILQLIRVLLFGYDPILGSKATGKLLSGQSPSAGLTFDTGKAISRRWTRTKTGGASEVNPPDGVVSVPQVLADFKTFLDKTGPQQLAYIITQTDLAALGYTREQLTADIKNVRPAESTEETEAALTAVVAELEKVNAAQDKEQFNINVWLEKVVSALKEKLKLDKAEVVRLTNAIQVHVSRQGDEGEQTARAKPVIEKEMEALREEMRRLMSENAVRAEQQRAFESKQAQADALKANLALPDSSERIASLRGTMAGLEERRTKQRTSQGLVADLNQKASKAAQLEQSCKRAEADIARIKNDLAQVATRECCPSCGYSGEEFRAFVKSKLEKDLGFAELDLHTFQGNLKLAQDEFRQVSNAYTLAKEADDDIAAAQTEWNTAHNELVILEDKQAQRDSAQDKLAAIELGEPPDAQATATATARIEAIKTAGNLLKNELNVATMQQADKLAREQTRQDKLKAEAKAEITKLAVDALAAKQEAIVTESMKSLLKLAGRFTDGIIDGELAWNDELGIWRAGQWVSHEVFSDMEQALAFVGLSVALAQSSPFKVVLLDRLECVDDENINTFLQRVHALIEDGTIHQAVFIDVNRKRWTENYSDLAASAGNLEVTVLEV